MAAVRDREGTSVGRGWVVALGDCRDLLGEIAAVDHVITDPPYSEVVHKGAKSSGRAWMPDVAEHACRRFRRMDLGFVHLDPALRLLCAEHFARVARRWVIAFSDVESVHLWRSDLAQFGSEYIRTLLWRKSRCAPQFTGDRPAPGFEVMNLSHRKGRKNWNGGGRTGCYEEPVVLNDAADRMAKQHTTQKPISLMLSLVADFTSPNDLILDPFAGSGTTGVAALRLGRRVILIEQDPKYAAICAERMQAEEQSSTLSALRAGQEPLFR